MADEDDSSKTEEPTPQKLAKSREQGQVAISQEIKSWAVLAAAALASVTYLPGATRELAGQMRVVLGNAEAVHLSVLGLRDIIFDLAIAAMFVVGPLFAMMLVVALLAGFGQVGLMWVPSKIAPKLNNVSPIAGFGRLFSGKALFEFAKGLVKVTATSAAIWMVVAPTTRDLGLMPWFSLAALIDRLGDVVVLALCTVAAIMTVIAALDYGYQKFTFLKQMRMSMHEVKEEHKQQEGDPQIQAKLRQKRAEVSRRRMMAAVPKADVVITNPTHYAVALKYDSMAMAAPTVVAKGVDAVARRIRDVAEEHDIPLVENPPLARSLYATVDLDAEVPPELYQAVAEVISYVMRLKHKLGGGRNTPNGGPQ